MYKEIFLFALIVTFILLCFGIILPVIISSSTLPFWVIIILAPFYIAIIATIIIYIGQKII
jgi:hypothetical protein